MDPVPQGRKALNLILPIPRPKMADGLRKQRWVGQQVLQQPLVKKIEEGGVREGRPRSSAFAHAKPLY